jgi:hypothetical protein
MANCSYSANGQLPSDAQFISAVRSKRFVGCVGKLNELEAKEVTTDELIDKYNVKYYGAVGDGVTDDTVAFQTALATGFAQINVPPGTYNLTDTLTLSNNQQLNGASDQSGILSFNNNDANFVGIVVPPNDSSLNNLQILYAGTNFTTSTLVSVTGSAAKVTNNIIGVIPQAPAFGVSFDDAGLDAFLFNNRIEGYTSAVYFSAAYSRVNILANKLVVGPGGTVIDNTNGLSQLRIIDNYISGPGGGVGIDTPLSIVAVGNIYDLFPAIQGAGIGTSTIIEPVNTTYSINTPGRISIDGTPVLNNQIGGWTSVTGASVPARTLATGDNTTAQLTNALKQLIADLNTHGLISATIT